MKLIRIEEVKSRTGKSRTNIYRDMDNGTFPIAVKVGDRAVAWVEAEVEKWISDRVAERDSGALTPSAVAQAEATRATMVGRFGEDSPQVTEYDSRRAARFALARSA